MRKQHYFKYMPEGNVWKQWQAMTIEDNVCAKPLSDGSSYKLN